MHNFSLYIDEGSKDVILYTNHGFTIVATVRLDERGDSYFGTGFWNEIAKFYVLKAGTKIALHISLVMRYMLTSPTKSSVQTLFQVSFLFKYLHVDLPSNIKWIV